MLISLVPTGAGAELDDCHILILASPPTRSAEHTVRATSGFMADAIDATSIIKMLDVINHEKGRVLQVFVKAEASPNGLVRGKRHTMLTDSDLCVPISKELASKFSSRNPTDTLLDMQERPWVDSSQG